MKKKLYRSMCIVACGTILLTAVVSLLIFYGLIETQIKETIRNECYLVAAGLNDTADEKAYFDELAKPLPETGRLSVIAADGTVLYDSVADSSSMENHAGRQEVQEALENGSGESSRYSDTLLQQTLYVARRLTDGTVLRISVSRATAGMLALGMLQPMLVVLVAEKRSALDNAVLAVWKVVSALFSVP